MGKYYDPCSRTNEDFDRDVANGKYDAYNRTDSGGIQTYQTTNNGDTIIKDVEPANNAKGHQQTDFTVSGGYITSIRPHND